MYNIPVKSIQERDRAMNESNIGQTIKSVVSILCVIGIIACVIAGIALIS